MTYTVQQVVGQGQPYGPNNNVIPFQVIFAEHPDKAVKWGRKSTPAPGEKVEGTIDWANQYGPTFKRTPSMNGSGGRTPRGPKEIAQIQRQHSQEMALRLLSQTESFKGLDLTTANPGTKRAALELIAGIADWFDRDIAQGAQKAINAGGYGAEPARKDLVPTGQSDVPTPPVPAPEPVASGSSDDIPF